MTERENYLKTVNFDHPEWIPMNYCINPACWNAYPHEALFEAIEAHPMLFPGWKRPEEPYQPEYGANCRRDIPYVDDFGCIWMTTEDGITGTVVGHPLADWKAFDNYTAPDPERCTGIGPIDWKAVAAAVQIQKETGVLTSGGLRHGHTFLQLCDVRGYENLLFDMEDEEPKLWKLIELVEHFNSVQVKHYLDMGVDVMGFAEDLGMQVGPMLSPNNFRKYIQPSYKRLMAPVREKATLIHMHSDGDIRLLADDIISGGVDIINLQDLVNGIDWIAKKFRGKTCVELDIDRQSVTRFGTPADVDALIREEVTKIADPAGGLMMIYGMYPGIPMENVWALMDAMERYSPLH